MSKLKKVSGKQISKNVKNQCWSNPEVNEDQLLLGINKYADIKKRKHVSRKRLRKFLQSTTRHGDLTIDDNGNVSLSENSDFIKALKFMPVDSRHCYLRDHIYNFPGNLKQAHVNVKNVLTQAERLILVNDTFTDAERLSENIDEYTSQFDTIKSSLTSNQTNPTKNIGEKRSNKPLEKIENEKEEQLFCERILETMEELLQKHPEVDISMILKGSGYYHGKPVSKKRLQTLILDLPYEKETDFIFLSNQTVTKNFEQEDFQNMPFQNRVDFMDKYYYLYLAMLMNILRLRDHQRMFEQINNSFTDEEKLAAEVLQKPIRDYSKLINDVTPVFEAL